MKVRLETAELAREKGFPIASVTEYADDMTIKLFKFNDMPTQSTIQQWLRDTHQIEIAVQWFDTCYIKAVNKKPFKANTYRVEGFQSYEHCLEIALQEALNLI